MFGGVFKVAGTGTKLQFTDVFGNSQVKYCCIIQKIERLALSLFDHFEGALGHEHAPIFTCVGLCVCLMFLCACVYMRACTHVCVYVCVCETELFLPWAAMSVLQMNMLWRKSKV